MQEIRAEEQKRRGRGSMSALSGAAVPRLREWIRYRHRPGIQAWQRISVIGSIIGASVLIEEGAVIRDSIVMTQ